MSELKVPRAWLQAGVKKVQTKVQARIDMSAEVAGAGLCPECKKSMATGFVNGIESWLCHEDRIAIPLPDEVDGELGPSTAQPGT